VVFGELVGFENARDIWKTARWKKSYARRGLKRCRKAASMHALNVFGPNGFVRKAIAPPAIACASTAFPQNAVMKMIGMREPSAFKRRCSSRPLTCGI